MQAARPAASRTKAPTRIARAPRWPFPWYTIVSREVCNSTEGVVAILGSAAIGPPISIDLEQSAPPLLGVGTDRTISGGIAVARGGAPRSSWLIGAALVVLAACPAAAQMFPPIGYRGLTADDRARMQAAAARLYQGQSIGAVERWRSPISQNAGVV